MKICENCNKEHNGTYGSGRFCCSKCARSYSTKNKRQEINQKVSKALKGNEPWNKGKIGSCSEETKLKLSNSNKGKKLSKEHKDKIGLAQKGRKHSKETKLKNSLTMKQRVKNGIHKGWQSRKIKSYPEIFFIEVLSNNNLLDKCINEFKISKNDLGLNDSTNYFLDFFFPEKMIDLEIDGKQHWEDPNRILSDKLRDEVLTKNGYKVYRIKWKSINNEENRKYMQNEINKFLEFYNGI